MEEDAKAIRGILTALLDAGKDIIFFMHSYGGIPGSAPVRGLGNKIYAAGVVRLVYVASHALHVGESVAGRGDYEGLKLYADFDEDVCPTIPVWDRS